MKKVLILEGKIEQKVLGYDHTFSFCSNLADSFPQDYATETEIEATYDQEFELMVHYLRHPETKEAFSYRDVDLLWCFKKTVIEFSFYIRWRYDILKKIMAKFPTAQFYLEKSDEISQYPSLEKVIQSSPLKGNPNIYTFEKQKVRFENTLAKQIFVHQSPFPNVVKIGKLNASKICIFSDYEKSKSILRKTKSEGCVLFSNAKSPKTLLRAIVNQTAFYQSAYDPKKRGGIYQEKTEAFVGSLDKSKLFSNFAMGELRGEELLKAEVVRLFKSTLPRLLFEIDHMHRFFSEATSLRSVLLDEDVSASKSAFCQAARRYGILSAVECHGALARKNGILPLTADLVFVWGRAQKNKLISWGCPEEQIMVSGCSRYNQYQKMDTQHVRNKIAKQFGFDPNGKIVLLAFPSTTINRGRWFWEDQINKNIFATLKALAESLSEIDSMQLLIKVHPGDERLAHYKEWVVKQRESFKNRVNIAYQFDPLLLAKAANFLIVYMSTYAVEGFALDKPVIYLFSDEDRMLNEIRCLDVFFYPRNDGELKATIRQLIQNSAIKPGQWEEAKKEYLNEGCDQAEDIIAPYLLDGRRSVPQKQVMNV